MPESHTHDYATPIVSRTPEDYEWIVAWRCECGATSITRTPFAADPAANIRAGLRYMRARYSSWKEKS